MARCPFCGYEADVSQFKFPRDPWKFRFYEVRMIGCPKCCGVFSYYSGISPKEEKSEFDIRIKP